MTGKGPRQAGRSRRRSVTGDPAGGPPVGIIAAPLAAATGAVVADLADAAAVGGMVKRRSSRAHAAILAATVDLLAELGFAGLTIEGIAARACVGKSTIYRHWTSKAELVIEAFGSLTPTGPPGRTGDLRTDLVERVRAIVAAVTNPPLAPILPSLVDAAERDPELAELHRRFTAQRRRFVLDVLEAGIDQGAVGPTADVELVADLLAGPVFYRRLISRAALGPAYAERLVDALLPMLQPARPANHTRG